ncbi:MAG: four helix bundle protein [Bacteroidia bacterium]
MEQRENAILNLTIEFSIEAIAFVEKLETQRKFVVANQLIKSATSIGANVHEAQNAESKADFIHKLKIAHKEADETMYWLTICEKAGSYPTNKELKDKLHIIIKVLSKIISSTKQKIKVNAIG